jgi:hypothetical protein
MTISDGKLISGSSDSTIKIWDLQTGKELHTLNGHQDRIICMTTFNGKLISGSLDKTIKIWDLKTGLELQTLNGHQGGISCIMFFDGKLISGSFDRTIKIWDFDLPPLLIEGIRTKEEYSQKLKCTPDYLPKIGICSPEDLQVLFNSTNFQCLQITAEEVIDDKDYAQPQIRAHRKKEIVFTLLDQLLVAAEQKSAEVKQCSVIRDDSGIVYDAPNPWTDFLKKLNSAQVALNTQGLTRDEVLEKFSPESYAELVKEVNALIDEFRAFERETQFVRLYAYVNQWGILGAWNKLQGLGINSLSALMEHKDIAPQDIFNMGE